MGQTLPFSGSDSVTIRKSIGISGGLAGGNFDNSNAKYVGEGCDRVGNRAYFNQKYTVSGAGLYYKRENITRNTQTIFGIGLTYGSHTESFLSVDSTGNSSKPYPFSLPDNDKRVIYGIHPYLKYDSRWIGIGGGFHAGKLSYAFHQREVEGLGFPVSGRKLVNFYPRLYLRFGPQDLAFLDYHLADHSPSAFPGYLQMIGLGTGFGSETGAAFRLGTLIGGPDTYNDEWFLWDTPFEGLYLTGYFPLKNGFTIEPLLLFDYSEFRDKSKLHFSLALHYELTHREIRRAAVPLY
jgi:hypothetical protein